MIHHYKAAELIAKGYRWAVVLRYDRGIANPAGTLLGAYKTHEAANRSREARKQDTRIWDLADVADEQALEAQIEEDMRMERLRDAQ